MTRAFVVHHNPSNGRYEYIADPTDAVASAEALLAHDESTWIAGNCRRMMAVGDLLLFKFGGPRLQQDTGIYAAAHVTQAPTQNGAGAWVLRYDPDPRLTRHLLRAPILGKDLASVVPRSFGASIQAVPPHGCRALSRLLDLDALSAEQMRPPNITRGLLILKEHLDKLLAGTKTWEVRGKATVRRGPIALIESKSGHVKGTCEITDVVGPLTLAELRRNAAKTGSMPSELPYSSTYAWVVRNARRLSRPVPYKHPAGAVIWVRLEPRVVRHVARR